MRANDSDLAERLFDDRDKGPIDPFGVFEVWYAEAQEHEINDPGAMALATVDSEGMPDVRVVLLNGHDQRGFVFFTNFESAKGKELGANPRAALNFHWKSLRRQVRIRGSVEEVAAEEADAYFATRPRGSRIGAHASDQSRPLASRADLVFKVEELTRSFGEGDVPRPAHWSGFRVLPLQIEFWKDGQFRLHDRMNFTRTTPSDPWTRRRLFP
jgi:pyridoxamine 5'-phosphate oxidase